MATIITLLWMRHGLSCANVLDWCSADFEKIRALSTEALYDVVDGELEASFGGFAADAKVDRSRGVEARLGSGKDCGLSLTKASRAPGKDFRRRIARLHDAYRDPALTDCAVSTSAAAGAALSREVGDVDLVLASALRRARETAAAAFPGRDVYEAPFVVERPMRAPMLQLDNEPREPRPGGVATLAPEGLPRNLTDWTRFLGFVGGVVAPLLEGGAASPADARDLPHATVAPDREAFGDAPSDYTVVLVGHGDMMRATCGLAAKPANNAVVSRRVKVDSGVVVEESGPCAPVMGAPPQPRDLTRGDVARCTEPFDVAPFLDLVDGDSACAAAAAAEDAFPFVAAGGGGAEL